MPARRYQARRIAIAAAIVCASALLARVRPVGAEGQGVLNQHIVILERNAKSFERKDDKMLAADLAPDYVRMDLFGRKQNRDQELEADKHLFTTATRLSEFSQPVRLTVQGGDATNPTVATTLVQTRRSAVVAGSDGRSHTTTWETVTKETRRQDGDSWKCTRREEIKRRVTMDGAPYIADQTPEGRTTRRELQSAYDSLALALGARSRDAAGKLLAPGFTARSMDEKSSGADAYLDAIEEARKAAWKTEYSFEVTGLQPKGDSAVVIAEHVVLRQAPDAQGVYKTVRSRITSRDTWVKSGEAYLLKNSEALLDEQEVVLPIQAAGWK